MNTKEIKVYEVQFNSALGRYLVMGEKGLVAQCVYLNDANKICDALNADTAIQALKADLERLVKMYGDKKNWGHSQYELGSMQSPFGDITIKDLSAPDENLNCHGGKLAREIGKKWGIKYE